MPETICPVAAPCAPLADPRRGLLLGMIGVSALAIGLAVYLVDRSGHSAYLLPDAWLAPRGTWRFGILAQWAPSFVHALAFSLFSAALCRPTRAAAIAACAFWAVVDSAFEIAQHRAVAAVVAAAVPESFARVPVLDHVATYVRTGTFDPGDLVAIWAGCALGLLVLWRTRARGTRRA